MNMLEAAVAYARRLGWPVLPCNGKTPLTQHGVKDATQSEKQLREWWHRWPEANIAVAIPTGIYVVDVDPRNGGDETLARLQTEHGPLPRTVSALTGGGGGHYVYRTRNFEGKLRGKLGPGIDLLGGGKYFLVSPSIHPVTGNRYRWSDDGHPLKQAVAEAPEWMLEVASIPEAPPIAPPAMPRSSSSSAYERAAAYLEHCDPAVSGQGGHTQAFKVAQKLVKGFCLDELDALTLLMQVWNPRCSPPWSLADLQRKVKQAASSGRMPDGALLNAGRG